MLFIYIYLLVVLYYLPPQTCLYKHYIFMHVFFNELCFRWFTLGCDLFVHVQGFSLYLICM